MFELLVLVALGVVVWLVFRSRKAHAYGTKTLDAREDQLLSQVEQAVLGLLAEFPEADNEEIATLLRDDLINHRVKDPRAFKWATPETVARMRRNVLRTVRAQIIGETAAPTGSRNASLARRSTKRKAKPSNVIRPIVCPACQKKTRGDRSRCMHCERTIDTSG